MWEAFLVSRVGRLSHELYDCHLVKMAGVRLDRQLGPDNINGTYDIDGILLGNFTPDLENRDSKIYRKAEEVLDTCAAGTAPCFINVWGRVPHHTIEPVPSDLALFQDLVIDPDDLSQHVREKLGVCQGVCDSEQGAGDEFAADCVDAYGGLRSYLAEVYGLDAAIGRLLAKLEDLSMQDNTMVVLTRCGIHNLCLYLVRQCHNRPARSQLARGSIVLHGTVNSVRTVALDKP